MKTLFTLLFLPFTLAAQNPPVATDDTLSTGMLQPVNAYVKANDYDPDGNPLTIVSATLLSGPVDSLMRTNSFIRVFPDSSYGTARIGYTVCDGTGLCDSANLLVYVNYMYYPAPQHLDLNQVNARFYSNGDLFWDKQAAPLYEVPKGGGRHTIFSGNPWFAGISGNDTVALVNRFSNPPHLISGPVRDTLVYKDSLNMIRWNQLWKLDAWLVTQHIQNYQFPGYVVPPAISNWPAHGNQALGEPANLAPYKDVNSNGIYDPQNGDFPIIKGNMALYFIYHFDQRIPEYPPLEFHGMAYQFSCQDEILPYTTFISYKIINRSGQSFTDARLGFWADFDIGSFIDDYIGSDVEAGMMYGYNGYPVDGNGGVSDYGANPPAQGIMVLNGPFMDPDGLDNPVGVNPGESINGRGFSNGITDDERWGMSSFIPYQWNFGTSGAGPAASDFYYFLSGQYSNATPVYSCDGLVTRFLYPGDSDTTWYYSTNGVQHAYCDEATAGNVPYDRSGIMGTGPFTFYPGEILDMELAFIYARDTLYGKSVDTLRSHAKRIRILYDRDSVSCANSFTVDVKETTTETSFVVKAYPNPVADILTVEANASSEFYLYDYSGRLIREGKFTEGKNQLQMTSCTPGLYLLELRSRQNRAMIKLLR